MLSNGLILMNTLALKVYWLAVVAARVRCHSSRSPGVAQ